MNAAGACELCGRRVDQLTRHHLIPRTRHSNKRNTRNFTARTSGAGSAVLCRPCHDQVQALIPGKALEREFNTLPAPASHPEPARFVAWIRTKPAAFRSENRESRGRGERSRW